MGERTGGVRSKGLASMVEKSPNPIDIHVGARVRLRRILLGISQEKLGEKLGLTFQQVQKYEKGSNRISASRLFQIGQILEVSVQFFFDDMPPVASQSNGAAMAPGVEQAGVLDFLNSSEGLQLNKAFAEIRDPVVRRKLVELLKILADQNGAASP